VRLSRSVQGSDNSVEGLFCSSANAQSVALYSNGVFVNNGAFGVNHVFSGNVLSRGTNTITGNVAGPTNGAIGSFPAN
jgi:hypothetical protein